MAVSSAAQSIAPRVSSSSFRIQGTGFRVFKFRSYRGDSGSSGVSAAKSLHHFEGRRVGNLSSLISYQKGRGDWMPSFMIQGLGFTVQGSGFRV